MGETETSAPTSIYKATVNMGDRESLKILLEVLMSGGHGRKEEGNGCKLGRGVT